MRDFTIKDREALIELLKTRRVMTEDQADVFTHALLDIRESAVEIYDECLPKLQQQLETNAGDVEDTIWDIREACRHIDYHLKDAKLPPGA
ncbi:MAG: hypothetical protein WAL89_15185 [Candidatus Sulfotelmatobacter sp.]|jgi:hypothetical protein